MASVTVLTLLVVLGVSCVTVFIAFVLFVHYQHRKYAHIPSTPRQGFFVGHAPILMAHHGKGQSISDAIVEMMRQCGPVLVVYFFFQPVVFVLDPNFVKETLLTNTHRKPYSFYKIFMKIYGHRFMENGLVSILDPDIHALKRTLLNPAFHKKYLQGLIGHFNAGADVLIEKLRPKADGKTEVAMLDEFSRTTLDIIAKVAFGMDLNATLDGNSPFNQAVSKCLEGADKQRTQPTSSFSPLPAARKLRNEVRDSINFLREAGRLCIEKRLRAMDRQDEVPNDILTYILKEVDGFKGESAIDFEGVLDEFVTLFIAGQETTANLLSFTLVELGHHPEVMHRLKTEVEAVFEDKEFLDYSDISKLTYMMQVFKETLRLWPPVQGTIRRMAHDVMVRGYKLPKGTDVLMSTYIMARMEEYFQDPLQFDPDRFKAGDDKSHYAYFPFSLGSRNCIGQQFALIEARVLLAKLLHKFNFDFVPGQGHGVFDEITLRPAGRCRNYLTPVE